jgi:hypothetical protein
MLDFPLESGVFIESLREAMELGLKSLNDSILENFKVKIVGLKKGRKGKTKKGKTETRIKISPSKLQKSPVNLKALQQTIKRRWQSTNLLDILRTL